MKVAGVREFRKDVPKLVKGREVVLVTWHGRPESMLLPLKDVSKLPEELRRELLVQTGREVRRQLRERGVSVERVLREFEAWRKARRAARRRR